MMQEWLIFPGRATQGRPEGRYALPVGATELRLSLNGGELIRGFFGPGRPLGREGGELATILFFYGNGMCLASAMDILAELRAAGMNVVAADYPGYGMSGGKPGEKVIYEMADALYQWAVEKQGLRSERLIPLGWSLGGGPAVHLASRRAVGALVLMSAFTSLLDVGKREFPFLPVKSILAHRFDNLSKMPQVRVPVVIVHGKRDALVPFSMAEQMRDAAAGPVHLVVCEDAGHNDLLALEGERVLSEIVALAARVTGTT